METKRLFDDPTAQWLYVMLSIISLTVSVFLITYWVIISYEPRIVIFMFVIFAVFISAVISNQLSIMIHEYKINKKNHSE